MTTEYFNLAAGDFSQDWSNTSLISADDNWSGVPSIVGYRGDGLTGGTGVDPQTVTGSSAVVDVLANLTAVSTTGGVAEFHFADPVVALQGSGTARAPHLVIHLDATGRQGLHLDFDARDLDSNADNSVQAIAVQYRIGDAGTWTNIPAGSIADASAGPSLTTTTHRSIDLPAAVNGQAQVQVRILTTDAVGSDEWIGIDNIVVSSQPAGVAAPVVTISDVTLAEGDAGTTEFSFTVSRSGGTGAFTVDYATAAGTATAGDDFTAIGLTTLSFADGEMTKTVSVSVSGDTIVEADDTFFVNLSNPTGGATIADGQGAGTIANDDTPPVVAGAPWINEFHYDDAGTDANEFIEVAGPAGLNLTGYSLVLYNGNGGGAYNTIALSGIIPDQSNGFGTISVPAAGLQNGGTAAEPQADGIALVGPGNVVVEFLSYEGVMTATNGPASGMTSTDVGVIENGVPEGASVALVGDGFESGDFSWQLVSDDTIGGPNVGQTFATPTARVRVNDVSVMEGDSGTATLTFTVTRSGPTQAFSVDFSTANGTAAAGSDYVATAGTLNFAEGQATATVSVAVNGDAVSEPSETLLLNLANPTNGATIGDAQGVGTILNDDVLTLATYTIQGAGHTSQFAGQSVTTEGVVVAVDTGGFWIQDPTGDGDTDTSDGLFVFTSAAPGVTAGQLVRVSGTVTEFGTGNNLTITQISAPTVTALGVGSVSATILGQGGRQVPTEVIDNDGRTIFDPAQDAMDFYESLEGMLVVVPDAQVTDLSDGNTFWVVADQGANATGMNDRGGITIDPGDFNPERIEVFRDSGVLPGFSPSFDMGDDVGDLTGVISYFGGSYEVILTDIEVTTDPGSPPDDVSSLAGDATHLTIAAYNLENIDPNDPDAKFQALADDIVGALNRPDIIGVEEIQDADGEGGGGDLSGAATAQKLIDAIVAAGGPAYKYVEVIPTENPGGAPGGNIRNGFLYNDDRVDYVAGSARAVSDSDLGNGDAYAGSRKPIAADFTFRGETITAIDVHSSSRIGSDPGFFGINQPPFNAGETQRIAQSQEIRTFVLGLQTANPNAHVAVMGDFNGFQFEQSLTLLEQGGSLTNLSNLLPADERYSYVFEGNSQQIDHMLVSAGLYANAEFDAVHLNSGQAGFRPTDHDPVLGRFLVNTGPTAANDSAAVDEDASILIDVLANDNDPNTGDTREIVSVSATAQGASVSIEGGQVRYVADVDAFDLLQPGQSATDSFTYVMRDAAGATSNATVSVTINGVADGAPINLGNGADSHGGTALDERIDGGNGEDSISGGEGADIVLGGNGADALLGGAGIDSLSGANGNDTVNGGGGDDTVALGRGADLIVFQGAFGDDLVIDFKSGEDDVRFENAGFTDFADFIGHAQQIGANTVVTNEAGDSVTFANTQIASLQSADFLFT